jgi:hypothetical protein
LDRFGAGWLDRNSLLGQVRALCDPQPHGHGGGRPLLRVHQVVRDAQMVTSTHAAVGVTLS